MIFYAPHFHEQTKISNEIYYPYKLLLSKVDLLTDPV